MLVSAHGVAQSEGAEQHSASPIQIQHPTVIAFFPAAQDDAVIGSNANESLADFQFYLKSVRRKFEAVGISLVEVSGDKFRVQTGSTTLSFSNRKHRCGYYLIAPNKPPRVEYGVKTDIDLIDTAGSYFGIAIH